MLRYRYLHNRLVIALLSVLFILSPSFQVFSYNSFNGENNNIDTFDVSDISVSEEYGRIKEIYKGKSDISLVYIEDVHGNFEVQKNCARIIKTIRKTFHSEKIMINIEGASGFIDTSTPASIPQDDIKKQIGDYFLSQGQINGAEYFSIVEDVPVLIYGAEDRDLYQENFEAFRNAHTQRKEYVDTINKIKKALIVIRDRTFSKPSARLLEKYDDFSEDLISVHEYAVYLNGFAKKEKLDLEEYRNVQLFLKVLYLENRIDGNKVEEERERILRVLQKKLTKRSYAKLVRKSLLLRAGEISQYKYYMLLKNTARTCGLYITRLPEFNNYVRLLALNAKINRSNLINELDTITYLLKDKLFASEYEKQFERYFYNFNIVKKLVSLNLPRDEAQYFINNRKNFTPNVFTARLRDDAQKCLENPKTMPLEKKMVNSMLENVPALKKILRSLPLFERFYQIALDRDKAIMKNVISRMKKEKVRYSILVAGGFHLEGITDELKAKDISYAVIVPNMTNFNAHNPYVSMMMQGDKSSFERILINENRGLALPSIFDKDPIFGKGAQKAFGDESALLVSVLALFRGIELKDEYRKWQIRKEALLNQFVKYRILTEGQVQEKIDVFIAMLYKLDIDPSEIVYMYDGLCVPFKYIDAPDKYVLMIGPESLANNIPVLEHGNIRKKKFTIVPYEQFTQHIEPTLEKISTPERASDIIDAILGISDVNSAQ